MEEFKIIFDKKPRLYLLRIPDKISDRIIAKIEETRTNPLHFYSRLEGRFEYKLRIGDYRVLADLDFSNKIIKITKIGHRRNIYEE